MSQGPVGHRPGGLTALAVLNFVFGGLNALGVLGMLTLLGLANAASGGDVTRAGGPIITLVYVAILILAVNAFLLIASGVGYLKQNRVWGKVLGTVYGLLGIVGAIVGYLGTKQFGIQSIVGLIYPVLTLVLLNTVFKDDFPY
jgi:hypothetical protein